jgi:hypothetical protein
MIYLTTRKEAQESGASHYFTGKPCIRGHIAPRVTRGGCTECREEDWKSQNERDKGKPKTEASKAAGRKYYQNNKELVKAKANARPVEDKRRYKRAWKNENPRAVKSMHLKRLYGITIDDYDAMLIKQSGVCAICGNHETRLAQDGQPSMLAVDHCHETGKVRGLLCHSCNNGIGFLNDDVDRIQAAIDYLNE